MKVELLSHFGDDLMIINAARVSYAKESSKFGERDEKLMKYLIEHGHTSVFRHPQLQFRVTCPIYVERQLFKHQVGISTNSVSGRYVDFSDSYYHIPKGEWRLQSKDSKQGSAGFASDKDQETCNYWQWKVAETCKEAYEAMTEIGIAKELARSILPLNLETTFIWTGSLLAFMNMAKQRLKPDAQKETREVVQMMLDAVQGIPGEPFKHALKYIENV